MSGPPNPGFGVPPGAVEAQSNLGLNHVSGQSVYTSQIQSGGQHSYSSEEVRAFVSHINSILGNDPDLKQVLPLDPTNHEIFFRVMQDGVFLCKMLNIVKPGLINPRHISFNPSVHHKTENLNTALRACQEIGIKNVNISAEDFLNGTRHLMLSLIWQIIRQDLLKHVNLEAHPEMITLMESGEDLSHFMGLTPENTLLRWFNQQLQQTGHPRRVTNFSSDIADGENYLALLNQIAPNIVPREVLQERNPQIRAQMVCDFAHKMGVEPFVTPKDINDGNRNLNLAFVADLFNKYPSIAVQQYDHLQSQALQQSELQSKLKLEEEERNRQARWAEEDARRQSMWAAEDQARRQAFENEDRRRREQEALQSQHLKGEEARLAFEQERLAEERKRLEEARARDQQARNDQVDAERRRLEEEKRRADEEMRRRDENARRDLDDQKRKLEDEKRAWEQTKANTTLVLPSPPALTPTDTTQPLFVADPYATQSPVPSTGGVDPYAYASPVPYSATTYEAANYNSAANYNPAATTYEVTNYNSAANYNPAATYAPPYDPYATGYPAGYAYGAQTTTTYLPGGGMANNQSHVEINISGKIKKKAMKNLTKNLPTITSQAQQQPGYMGSPPPGYPNPAAGYGGGPGYYGQPPAY